MEREYTTKNGVKIYGYKNPLANSFYIALYIRCGSMFETAEENGITHFLEHTAIRNVNKIMGGKLYSELDRHGVEFNASTYYEMVQFYVSGAPKNFEFSAKVISEILSPVILTKEEIDAERKRIKAEIREGDEKSSLQNFTSNIVHQGTSLSRSITGSLGSVNKITGRKLESFRSRVANKNNIFFYATGNFTDKDISTLSEFIESHNIINGEKNENIAPVPKNFGKRSENIAVKNSDYTAVRFTFDLDMTKVTVAETDLVYDILLSGYNSRFYIEMSERRGMFYDISGAIERYLNIGEIYFTYEVREKDLLSAIKMTADILREFKNALLSESECMKAGYVDNSPMLLDEARDLNFTFAYDNHIMDLGYPDVKARAASYDNVTPSDIRRTACEIFRPENLTLTIKGCKRKINISAIKDIVNQL